ncbi:hypothetical protein V3F56_10215 [Moorellaceae bacterium AZ2]
MDMVLNTLGHLRPDGRAPVGLPASRQKGGVPGWRVGQVIEGRVLAQLSENSYILLVEGQEILARSACSLSVGQPIVMEVQEFRDNQYTVKLLSPNSEQKENAWEALKSVLEELGIKDTPLHRALIQGFMAWKLPLSTGRLKQATLMLQLLQAGDVPSPEEIGIVLHALKRDLPPRPEVLQSLRAFINAQKETGQGSITSLVRFISLASPSREEFLTGKQGESLWLQLKAAAEAVVLKPNEGPARVAEQLRSLLGSQLPQVGPPQEFESVWNGREGRLVERESSPGSDLLAKFRQFIRELERHEATAEKSALLASLKEEGHTLERQLWGQQLWQIGKGEGEAYLYFNLPVLLDGQILNWGELLIKKDEGSAAVINPQDFTVNILVHTSNLGTLCLEIKVRNSEVTVRGKVQHLWVSQLLDTAWPALQEALTGLGYRLHKATWEIGQVTSKFHPEGTPGPDTIPGVTSVDVKV